MALAAFLSFAMMAAPGLSFCLQADGVQPPNAGAPLQERRARAEQAYRAGRHAESARRYEELWDERRDPADLFNAALSRYQLRHHAHVNAYLERLPRPLDAARTEEVALLQSMVKEHVVRVPLEIASPQSVGAPLRVDAVYRHATGAEERSPLHLEFSLADSRWTAVSLDAGSWTLTVVDARFEPTSVDVHVRKTDTVPIRIPLRFREARPRIRTFAGAWSIVGLAFAGTGAGLLIVSQPRWREALDRRVEECDGDYPLADCRQRLASAAGLRGAGAGLLSTGLGAAIGGLTALATTRERRRAAWISEASVAAASLIGGSILAQYGAAQTADPALNPWIRDGDADSLVFVRGGRYHLAGTALIGVGSGLLSAAITGLIVQRAGGFLATSRRRHFGVDAAVRPAGLSFLLSARF